MSKNKTKPKTPELPRFNQIIPMPEGGVDALPDTPYPYFVASKEDFYQRMRNALGWGVVPSNQMPQTLRSIGTSNRNGVFTFDAPPVPANICAQAVDFFRRIYEKYKTEAQVILTMHRETKEYRIFIPRQKTSGGHVKYDFDPQHINENYLIVGTMHSHPSFNAFHSGTDIDDAKKMDGLHFTIGHVYQAEPDVVGLASMGGMIAHYKDVATLADFSNLDAAKAPEWWDNFVEAPTTTSWSSTSTKPKSTSAVTPFSAHGAPPRQYQRSYSSSFWSEAFTDEFLDALYASQLLTWQDTNAAAKDKEQAKTKNYWRDLFIEKMERCEKILDMLGLDVTHTVLIKKPAEGEKLKSVLIEEQEKEEAEPELELAEVVETKTTDVVTYDMDTLPPLTEEEIAKWLLPGETISTLTEEDKEEIANIVKIADPSMIDDNMTLGDLVAFKSVAEAADKAVLEN